MLGLTFTLALEGKKRNIRVNAIAPLAASRMMETVRSKVRACGSKGEFSHSASDPAAALAALATTTV